MQTIRSFDLLSARMVGRLVLAALAFTIFAKGGALSAADASPAKSLSDLAGERERLGKQVQDFVAAGRTDEAMVATKKLIAVDRQALAILVSNKSDKKGQEILRQEVIDGLDWLISTHLHAEAWSVAAARQAERADMADAIFGKTDYRAIDARNDQVYYQRLASLKSEEARALVKVDGTFANFSELYAQGKYSEATRLAQEAATVRQKLLGKYSPRLAGSLNNLAMLYRVQGDYARAEPLFRQALEISKKALGENHPDYATSLNNLAKLYYDQGDYARAEPFFRQALGIRKKVVGENHPDYAQSLNNLATMYGLQGDYARAEPLFRQALEIKKKALGENHPDYAISLNSLARLYRAQGDYARAEPLLRQALEIQKKVLGENHPHYAISLNSLARLYHDQGDYARAEPLLRQALEIQKKVLGENHPDYATSLNNLAMLYHDQGDYARAEPLCRQALEIRKEVLGENRPDYAGSLGNLAILYRDQGDYARAGPLYRQALEIKKKVLGENNPDYVHSLNNLAELYHVQGDYARAEPLYRQALQIHKKVLGENHADYAVNLNNLADLYGDQGDNARAEPLLRQASEILKRVLGENHPHYATSLNNLGVLYQVQSDYARAEPLLRQALEITKKALGENDPGYAISLNNLALMYKAQGDYARAEPLYRQAVSIEFNDLEATALIQSQRQQLAMLKLARHHLDDYLTLAADRDQFYTSAYQQMLAWKGMVFRREQLTRAGEQTPELAGVFRQLQQTTGQLAKQAWAKPDPKQQDQWRKNVERLSAEKERLEAELSAQSAPYRQAKKQVTFEELQQALPANAVLVDFLEYGHFTPADKKVGTKETREWRYIAFLVRHEGPVARINLGPSRRINETIETWRKTFGQSLQGGGAGKLLREKLWEPIEAKFGGAKIVLVSPDGALSRLPLAALPGKEAGHYLIEDYTIAIVPTAQVIPQLVRDGGRKPLPKNLLLMGNIDYDAPGVVAADTVPVGNALRGVPYGRDSSPSRNAAEGVPHIRDAPASFQSASIHFGPLAGTVAEVAAIAKLCPQGSASDGVTRLEKEKASKAAFLAEGGQHRYLHLATHGFFIEEKLPVLPRFGTREAGRIGEMLHGPGAAEMHPALRCGLALAGANRASPLPEGEGRRLPSPPAPLPSTGEGSKLHAPLAGHHVPMVAGDGSQADNGILTAEEIGTQNLDGVQLVVLSACETGLGKSAGGEGVLGLQRSFHAAGARNVVASLWPVNDQATCALMTVFYTKLWKQHKRPIDALREAQLYIYHHPDETDKLAGPRGFDITDTDVKPAAPAAKPGKTASPELWAGFVLSGVGK